MKLLAFAATNSPTSINRALIDYAVARLRPVAGLAATYLVAKVGSTRILARIFVACLALVIGLMRGTWTARSSRATRISPHLMTYCTVLLRQLTRRPQNNG